MKFSNERALYAINFIQSLRLGQGQFAGKQITLLPWQYDFLKDVYGTLDDDGRRQYTTAYLEIPKKTGKSTLGAGIALYHTFADGEQRGEIYSCAADRSQASLIYDIAVDMVNRSPVLKKRCKLTLSQKMMEDVVSGSRYKVLSSESKTKHGLNCSCVIFDELHAQPDNRLWTVMTEGSGDARTEPLWYVITTAGDDADRKSIGWEIHERARRTIDGEIANPHWYCKIWGIEPDYAGDIYDEALWYKVNPSLGHTIEIKKMREAALEAQISPDRERNFRWLRLNQWCSNKRIGWLPITLWDKTQGEWSRADMLKRECYVGIDLSSTTDLTAITTLFPPQGNEGWRFFVDAWIPEDNMKERENRDHVPFSKWVKAGHIHATPGNVVDFGYLANHIEKLSMDYKVKYFCGDPWHLEVLRQMLKSEDQNKFIQIPQTMAGMSPAMHELEKLFMNGGISHEMNPMGRWTFGNVNVATDGNENKKPMKNKSIDRIDPVCALIDAMAAAIKLEPKKSVYEDRGLRVI